MKIKLEVNDKKVLNVDTQWTNNEEKKAAGLLVVILLITITFVKFFS